LQRSSPRNPVTRFQRSLLELLLACWLVGVKANLFNSGKDVAGGFGPKEGLVVVRSDAGFKIFRDGAADVLEEVEELPGPVAQAADADGRVSGGDGAGAVMLVVVGAPLGHPARYRWALRSMTARSTRLTGRVRSPVAALAGADRADLGCSP